MVSVAFSSERNKSFRQQVILRAHLRNLALMEARVDDKFLKGHRMENMYYSIEKFPRVSIHYEHVNYCIIDDDWMERPFRLFHLPQLKPLSPSLLQRTLS
ncbi:hypothetical protein CEXT_700761 [Caerostris extrusa]|uniref:Uncharacterized protein n=1 Tax=Caerostris extrusa TaxID=172846 RepID=A0AAV4PZI5_CAEEX|nr:hypothetical protein CEXT_700761 [Caerostris extrusa]